MTTTRKGKCLGRDITIRSNREVVQCDELEFPWDWKPDDGYFLVRLHEGQICVGYVDEHHDVKIEFRGTDPEKMVKEIARRNFLNSSHMGYIGGEILLAHQCLVSGTDYVQR